MTGKSSSGICPDSHLETLTMLYLQNQELNNLTPEQLLDSYEEVYDRMKSHYESKRADRRRFGWP